MASSRLRATFKWIALVVLLLFLGSCANYFWNAKQKLDRKVTVTRMMELANGMVQVW